jgi:hypothetical protein
LQLRQRLHALPRNRGLPPKLRPKGLLRRSALPLSTSSLRKPELQRNLRLSAPSKKPKRAKLSLRPLMPLKLRNTGTEARKRSTTITTAIATRRRSVAVRRATIATRATRATRAARVTRRRMPPKRTRRAKSRRIPK